MTRSSKVILITVIILIAITFIGVILASLDLLYHTSETTPPVNTQTATSPTAVASQIVILHAEPVTVSRFSLTVALVHHTKINDKAIDTTISLEPADDTHSSIHFSGIGEVVETTQYRFRLVNATEESVQLLVLQLTPAAK